MHKPAPENPSHVESVQLIIPIKEDVDMINFMIEDLLSRQLSKEKASNEQKVKDLFKLAEIFNLNKIDILITTTAKRQSFIILDFQTASLNFTPTANTINLFNNLLNSINQLDLVKSGKITAEDLLSCLKQDTRMEFFRALEENFVLFHILQNDLMKFNNLCSLPVQQKENLHYKNIYGLVQIAVLSIEDFLKMNARQREIYQHPVVFQLLRDRKLYPSDYAYISEDDLKPDKLNMKNPAQVEAFLKKIILRRPEMPDNMPRVPRI